MTTLADPTTLAPRDAERLAALDAACEKVWEQIMATAFYQRLTDGTLDLAILRRFLLETYHYVRHNAKNQAAVVLRASDDQSGYIHYCLKHAMEENGHERMCLNDLASLGFPVETVDRFRPLPATATFVAFLYHWAQTGNPVARLGYSYFAEGAHTYLGPAIARAKAHYGLTDNQLTFFVSHGLIDEKHFAEVREAVVRHCRTDQDWDDVLYMIEVTGGQTAHMLAEVVNHPLEAA